MILNISPIKSFLASILAAVTGTTFEYISDITLDATNIAFQHCAWTIAILAGLVSAVNGILSAIEKYRVLKNSKNETD